MQVVTCAYRSGKGWNSLVFKLSFVSLGGLLQLLISETGWDTYIQYK